MSIATEIERIQTDKATIKTKLVELGLVTNTANLDTIAEAVSAIANRGAVSVTVQEGNTYTIPAGYHNGAGTVSGVGGGGSYSLQSKSGIIPTKQQQSITADEGYYGLSDVTINAIPDIYQDVSSVTATAGDVLSGKIIITATGQMVAGTMSNNGAVNKTINGLVASSTSIPAGYTSGGTVSLTSSIEDALAAI